MGSPDVIPNFSQFAASARKQLRPTDAALLREIGFRTDPSGWTYRSKAELADAINVSESTAERRLDNLIADYRIEKCPALRRRRPDGSIYTTRPCGYRPIPAGERAALLAADEAAEAAQIAEETELFIYRQNEGVSSEESKSLSLSDSESVPAEARKIAMGYEFRPPQPAEQPRTVAEQLAVLAYGGNKAVPVRLRSSAAIVEPVRSVAEQLALLGFAPDGAPLAPPSIPPQNE